MEVPSGPWADLALLLRRTDREAHGFLPLGLLGLLLFLCVCLLLLQLIVYLRWKLTQGSSFTRPTLDADLSALPRDGRALSRQLHGTKHPRTRRGGSHAHT
ncbi:uncharacterized protein ACO6RY_09531 [Pungitius sinensis]